MKENVCSLSCIELDCLSWLEEHVFNLLLASTVDLPQYPDKVK